MSLLGFIGLGIMAKNALTPKWSASKGAAEYANRHPSCCPEAGKIYGDYPHRYKPDQFIWTKIPVTEDKIPDGIYTITMPDGRKVTKEYRCEPVCLSEKGKKYIIRDNECESIIWEDTLERNILLNIGREQEINISNAKEKIKMYERYDRECDLDKIVKLEKVIKDNETILNDQKGFIEETEMFIKFFENYTFDMYRKFNDLECWGNFLEQLAYHSKNNCSRLSDEERKIVWEILKKDVVDDELRVDEKETRKFLKSEHDRRGCAIGAANAVIYKYKLSLNKNDTKISMDDLRELYEGYMKKYGKYSNLGWW